MNLKDLPPAALKLYSLLGKEIETVTSDEAKPASLFLHYKDGTTVRMDIEVINRGGKETVH